MSAILIILAMYGVTFGLMNKLPRGFYFKVTMRDGVEHTKENDSLIGKMLRCSYCTGFHAGWLVWLWDGLQKLDYPEMTSWGICNFTFVAAASLLAYAFAGAATGYLLDIIAERLERE